MKIIATNKETGKTFTAFKGSESECLEKMICLKIVKAGRKDGLSNEYNFRIEHDTCGLSDSTIGEM